MGVILDSSVSIAGERRALSVEDMLLAVRAIIGPTEIALSVVSVMELEHGIWRAYRGLSTCWLRELRSPAPSRCAAA